MKRSRRKGDSASVTSGMNGAVVEAFLSSLLDSVAEHGRPQMATASSRSAPVGAMVREEWDCLKIVRFRHSKLGLTLAPVGASQSYAGTVDVGPLVADLALYLLLQAGDRSGTKCERVVVMAKHRELLEPQVDRLLCVGDELVSIQGQPVAHCGLTFQELLERLRSEPRPVELGFLPAAR